MTADRLTSLLRPQRWRWDWSFSPGPRYKEAPGAGVKATPWRPPFVNSPVYAEARQALTS